MRANVGDQLTVRSRKVGQADRIGVILEVRGQDGDGPYLVRWNADGHEGLYFPGSDAQVRPAEQPGI